MIAACATSKVIEGKPRPALPANLGQMVQKDTGTCFEIRGDGKTRSHRDRKETAIEAGRYLKQMRPKSEIIVRDVCDNSITVIEREKGLVLDLVAASNKVLRR